MAENAGRHWKTRDLLVALLLVFAVCVGTSIVLINHFVPRVVEKELEKRERRELERAKEFLFPIYDSLELEYDKDPKDTWDALRPGMDLLEGTRNS